MSIDALMTVVVPCYNESLVLDHLYQRMNQALEGMNYEVICVDDGSGDETWEKLSALSSKDPRWKSLRLSRNFGHQNAVSAGLKYSSGAAVCIIDADLQDPPEALKKFWAAWQEGNEVVYGVRNTRLDRSFKKLFAWGFYRILNKLSHIKIPLDAGDFCLLDRKVVDVLNQLPERNRYLRGLRVWCGFKHQPVNFDRDERLAGEPKYTFRKSLKLALDGVFSFSALPLAMASHFGLWVSVIALLATVFTFVQRMFPNFFDRFGMAPGPGFATIVISILFLGGIQLICLGILGEYLGRIYDEVKGRPAWLVSEKLNLASTKDESI